MKGVIFVIFEDFVTETWGAETFEDLLDACPAAASERLSARVRRRRGGKRYARGGLYLRFQLIITK